jgi:hypothetical protein
MIEGQTNEQQAEGSTTTETEAPAPKAKTPRVKREKVTKPAKVAATPKKAVATPAIELYAFRSAWTGPSDVRNKRLSRTKLDASCFNAFPSATVTQRDQDAMVALRKQFGGKAFERRNCDAGILRRLMERGLAKAVDANNVNSPTSKFALTTAGQGKPSKKAA